MDAHESTSDGGSEPLARPARPLSKAELDAAVTARLEEIWRLVREHSRGPYHRGVNFGDDRVTLGCVRPKSKRAGEDLGELPPKVLELSKKVRRLYAVLRDARSEEARRRKKGDTPKEIGPTAIAALYHARWPTQPVSERHLYRGLKALGEKGAIYRHPDYGYFLGSQQPTLTF
jgi:hypothetical protein